MKNDSPMNISIDYASDSLDPIFHTPVGTVDRDGLEDIVEEIGEIWFDGACGSPDGWCIDTFTVRDGRSAPRVERHDVRVVGPGTDEVDRDDLPTAEEAREMASDRFEYLYVA